MKGSLYDQVYKKIGVLSPPDLVKLILIAAADDGSTPELAAARKIDVKAIEANIKKLAAAVAKAKAKAKPAAKKKPKAKAKK